MNDFISRKTLLQELKKYVEDVYECNFDDSYCTTKGGSTNPEYVQGLWEAKEIIEELPTAYDVDKVMEKLENNKHPPFMDNWTALQSKAWAMATDNAISIVKAGGIDENLHTHL